MTLTRRSVVTLLGTGTALAGSAATPQGNHGQSAAELAAGVTPTNNTYPPGNPRRYGAVGDGVTDDTAALTACISCNSAYSGNPGDVYGVSTITFKGGALRTINFNGSAIKGIATKPQISIVKIESNFADFYDYKVDGSGNGGSIATPNPNYTCGTQWQGSGVSGSGSQFNNIFGMRHIGCVRGVIYGVPIGSSSKLILSENAVFGFSSVGVSNPLLLNSGSGFLHLSNPTLFSDTGGWTHPKMPSTARVVEVVDGNLYAQGGEMEFAETAAGFAADLKACTLVGMNWECSPPVRVTGDGCKIIGGQFLNNQQNTSAFVIANGVTGTLRVSDMDLFRLGGTGAASRQTMVDATAADPGFLTVLNNTSSEEWPFALVARNVRLVTGGKVSYRNHRFTSTAGAATFILNSEPNVSLLNGVHVDHMGYTTTGWTLVSSADGSTIASTSAKGPANYLSSQLTLRATGPAAALAGDPTSLTTIKDSMLRVRPGELYWGSVHVNVTSGTSAAAIAAFYNLSGAPVSQVAFADAAGMSARGWNFVEGPIVVPATAAYMAVGMQIAVRGDLEYTDMRVQRA